MRRADIKKGNFYIGGNMDRIREVTEAHEIWVDWRDIDPETLRYIPLAMKTGQCTPKTFAVWAKRKAEPEEVSAVLARRKARAQNASG